MTFSCDNEIDFKLGIPEAARENFAFTLNLNRALKVGSKFIAVLNLQCARGRVHSTNGTMLYISSRAAPANYMESIF